MIETAIKLQDSFSQPLMHMSNALNMTISHFETLQDVSSQAVDTTSLKSAKDELARMQVGFDKVTQEVAEAESKQRKFNSEIEKGNMSANNLYSTFKRVAAVVGVGKLMKDGFDVFVGFEQAMADLKAVTMASEYEMEALTYTAKKMGETTAFSASQGAEGMMELAKGGLEIHEVIQGIPHVLDLAAISGMGLAESAGIAVDVMNGFSLQANELKKVIDLIAYTSSNASTDVALMGSTFMYSAKIADTFGASIEHTAAAIGMMSSAAKGSKAGRALAAGFNSLAGPTERASVWLNRFGTEVVDTATGNINELNHIVDNLAENFAKLGEAEQLQAAKDIFGEHATAWLAIIQQGVGAMDQWLEEFETSSIDTAEKMKEIMLSTTQGILQIHQSEIESIWINFYEGLADGVVGEAFQSMLAAMRNVLQIGLTFATGVIITMGYAVQFVANNFDLLLPIMVMVATVWAVHNAEMLTSIGLTIKNIAVKAVERASYYASAAAMMVQTAATFFLTWATQGLSVALATLPITWVVAGIVIIIAAIYLAVAAFNKLAGTSLSATGIIIGSVFTVGAVIFNTVALAWNVIATFIEFLINVWVHPEYAAQMAWYNISMAVLNFVEAGSTMLQKFLDTAVNIANEIQNAFVSAFNWIVSQAQKISFEVPDWVPKIGGKEFTLLGNVEMKQANPIKAPDVAGWVGDMKASLKKPELPESYIEIPKMNSIDLMDAYNKGYGIGADLGNKVSDFFSFGTEEFDIDKFLKEQTEGLGIDDMMPGDNIGDMLGDIADNAGKTAGNTKGIKDKMKATEEDIKYLRDIAASSIVNRFTTNTIQVTNNNEMKIDSQMDLDGVVNDLATGLEENIEIGMEGI